MHQVKCFYCEQMFDRDKEPFIKVNGRRYAHKKCSQNYQNTLSQEEQDKIELEQYILKIFNESYLNAKIKKQIESYIKQYNYTYSGIYKTLLYWFEVQKKSIEEANGGIGIVPYIYNEALNYYYQLYLAQEANKNKTSQDYLIKTNTIEIYPPSADIKLKHKLFNLKE